MNKQRRRNVQAHGVGRQIPGCLGRMVNLFDFGTVGNGKKLLTEKPHFDNGSIRRNQLDQIEVDVMNGGVNGTPMKMLLEQEMSKEMEFKLSSTNLVAKLMGLDSFPQIQPAQRSNSSKPRLKRSLSHGEYKDVYEIWQKPGGLNSDGVEGLSKKKMDAVREKFLEAKRLVADDKLRHSKEFQEAMEVLSDNKELFLEFLQESNSFFSHHLHSFQSTAPPTSEKSKRITILKPSKTIVDEKLGNEAAIDSGMKSEKSLDLFKWPVEAEHLTRQSTRIVVLKPNGHVTKASSCPTSPRGFEERESRDVARRVKKQILKEETLRSSVFSNGYIGDDSSLNDYADSEIMSPVSRHSWDYINKYDSPFSSSPFSRASDSPESSSVCREAKKRLSERWALMAASNENLQESKVMEKKVSNSTLGDMLALPDLKDDLRVEEDTSEGNEQEGLRVYASCVAGNVSREEENLKSLRTLARSKSLPESSTSFGHKSLDTNKGKSKVPEELTKSKSLKWSLKGKVSSFLFSRNKKSSKERSYEGSQVVNSEILDSRCNDEYDASVSARSMNSHEGSFSIAKATTFGNSSEWRDEPSLSSVLETSFDEDDGIFFNSSIFNRSSSSLEREMTSNLIGKSPPIGSIGRTFSFDDSTVARCLSSKRSTTSTRDEEEDLRLLINTLLSAADLDAISDDLLSKWHSVESPLDPSLRNSYADSTEQQRLGSNMKKLVFDLVNTLLLELTPSFLGPRSPLIISGKSLRVYVINRMQECLTGNGRVEDRWWDEDGDLSSLAVNKVVRVEVAELGSPECLRLEMDSMGEELELKLLEELVEEALMDLSERPKLFIPSIC
ncbi:hypothetical protein CARUB_v10025855mg [Capsella rubella]|nr:uncharacterized protein LOC17876009 isoform X2 [Capsella rubella]EOA12882.1 hypothetical protein CARUB_v10025855mg [Capsella rubella]